MDAWMQPLQVAFPQLADAEFAEKAECMHTAHGLAAVAPASSGALSVAERNSIYKALGQFWPMRAVHTGDRT